MGVATGYRTGAWICYMRISGYAAELSDTTSAWHVSRVEIGTCSRKSRQDNYNREREDSS